MVSQPVYIMQAFLVSDHVLLETTGYYLDFCAEKKTVIEKLLKKSNEQYCVTILNLVV